MKLLEPAIVVFGMHQLFEPGVSSIHSDPYDSSDPLGKR